MKTIFETTTALMIALMIFGTAFSKNVSKNTDGTYSDWPKWENHWMGKYVNLWNYQLRKTITYAEYRWLPRSKQITPEECAKAIELKERLYANMPNKCDLCQTEKERQEQKTVNLDKLYKYCEFSEWNNLNSFIKNCKKRGYYGTTAKKPSKVPPLHTTHTHNQPVITPLSFYTITYDPDDPNLSQTITDNMTGNVMPVGFNIENNSIEIIYLTKNIYNLRE